MEGMTYTLLNNGTGADTADCGAVKYAFDCGKAGFSKTSTITLTQ